jgi:Xaa-Pro aminopeptidase
LRTRWYATAVGPGWPTSVGRPTTEQRDLYKRAYDQLCHNMALIKPGVAFRDLKARAYAHPEGYRRLDLLAHGIGMSNELPFVLWSQADDALLADDVIEPGMALCIEAYAGRVDGPQGVKLEEQILVTAEGIEVLTRYPFEHSLL